jgi:hypothetical protein
MEVETAHKNIAFEVLMDKSDANENMEGLRKAKILELERKRQFRM